MDNGCTCRTCGTKFHHCSSCGMDGYSEEGFCSYKCLENYEAEQKSKAHERFSEELGG